MVNVKSGVFSARRKKTSILAFHPLRRNYNDKVNKRMTENSPIFNYELAKVGKVP